MSISLGTELWDKPDAIITFNECNTLTVDKIQKVIGDYCKAQLTNTFAQKRSIERFLCENEALNNSQFSFSSSSYFLTQQVLNIINTQETFSNAFLNEIDEIVKTKTLNIKKDSRLMKADNKVLFDDLLKENQKLENSLKRYRAQFNAKEVAHNALMKAEENKALSRNQVDNFNSIYKSKRNMYEKAKNEYLLTLNSFNNYQTKHYSIFVKEWSERAQNIENERYNTMRTTFTSVSELCKSMASKFNEIANDIESRIETIECDQDYLTLINQEKTGDVPPLDVPFKDFDVQENAEIEEPRVSKTSISGSDSASSNGVGRKSSITELNKSIRISPRNSLGSINKEHITVANGSTSSGFKFIGKLFGGTRKSKEPIVQSENNEPKSEQIPTDPEVSIEQIECCPNAIEIDECDSTKETCEPLGNECPEESIPGTLSRVPSDSSTGKRMSLKNYVDENLSSSNMSLLIKRSRGSFRNFLDKRRSRSLSGLLVVDPEQSTDGILKKPIVSNNKPKLTSESKSLKPKPGQKPKPRGQSIIENNRESIKSKIEVIRAVGEVEIVSTPAEALASVARSSALYSGDQETYAEVTYEDISVNATSTNSNQTYNYYYVGSCVAIHGYTSTDPSNIYLSFDIGEQFYIIKEDDGNESSGWLLVERIDRSQSGYVPASYMDTRKFDEAVLMHSDHAMQMV